MAQLISLGAALGLVLGVVLGVALACYLIARRAVLCTRCGRSAPPPFCALCGERALTVLAEHRLKKAEEQTVQTAKNADERTG